MLLYVRGVTTHISHHSVRTSVFKSRFGIVVFLRTAILFFNYIFELPYFGGILVYKCCQTNATHEKTSNTIEDKNTINSRT